MTPLLGMTLAEIEALLASWGEPRYRARQIFRWLYREAAPSFAAMTNLPAALRKRLVAEATLGWPEVVRETPSADDSSKFLLNLSDGERVEAVFMPTARHDTLCLSSQAGCAMECAFCATATMGLGRHMTTGEIAGEALALMREKKLGKRRVNILFMGMGEPLHNYDAVMGAFRLLTDKDGAGLSPRRITLSTVGLVPAIERLAREPRRPNLAVSLNATTDEQRQKIMPVNKKYPLKALLAALRKYPRQDRESLTLEYVLLRGVNDSPEDAARLRDIARSVAAKVNLIAYNEVAGLPFARPSDAAVLAFQRAARDTDVRVFIRRPRGRDVAGACGQLRLEDAAGAGA